MSKLCIYNLIFGGQLYRYRCLLSASPSFTRYGSNWLLRFTVTTFIWQEIGGTASIICSGFRAKKWVTLRRVLLSY